MSRNGPPESLPNAADQAKGAGLEVAQESTPDLLELLESLPQIPVLDDPESYPEDLPEAALAHVPWL